MDRLDKKFYLLKYKSLTQIADELNVSKSAITFYNSKKWPKNRAEQLEEISGGKIKSEELLK
jgi:predicted DNA-binding protein YlxM (UPF0122 family)